MSPSHRSPLRVSRAGPSRPRRRCPTAGAAAVLIAAALGAAPPGADRPAEGPGTLVLFDGKSLAGWKETDFAGSGGVEVKDGALVLKVGNPMTGVTSTRQDLPRT